MFLQQLVNGLTMGSVYALVALGYTMVYGVLQFINFAHGEIFMWGAFFGLFAARLLNVNFLLVLPVVVVMSGILGVLLERVAYRPLRAAPRLVVTTSALGASIFLSNLARLTIGSEIYPIPSIFPSINIKLGEAAVVNTLQLLVLITAILLMIFLNWFVNRTRYGRAIRATSEDRDTAGLMGVNIDKVVSVTFALGSALGGAAGLLVGMYYDAVYATMGYAAGMKAFTAAILGGIGSIPGAMLGGVLLGIIENFGVAYVASSYRDAFAFAVLILVLLVRPSGLFGTKS